MPKRPRPIRRAPAVNDPRTLLDQVEEAVLAANPAKVASLTERLFDLSQRSEAVADEIVDRLIEGRSKFPLVAFEILTSVTGEDAVDYLARIAEHPAATDLTRFAAQRRIGWPERGEAKARRAFLATLTDVNGVLVQAVATAALQAPPDAEVLTEVLGYLTVLEAEDRKTVIARLAEEPGRAALPLFHALLHVKDQPAQRQALALLAEWRDPASTAAVRRLAATGRNKTIRGEAEKVAARLSIRAVDGAGPDLGYPMPPLTGAYLSNLDGEGASVAIVIREPVPGIAAFANVLIAESEGIKDVIGVLKLSAEDANELLDDLQFEGAELIPVDLDAVHGALAIAVEMNAARKKPIPATFELWESFFHDEAPPPADEPVTRPELDDQPFAGRDDLLAGADELLDHLWFDGWFFAPDTVMPVMNDTPPPRRGQMLDSHYRPFVERLWTDDFRARVRGRLRRQAWLLAHTGEPESSDQALAVAAFLADATPDDLVKSRFVRRYTRESVDNAKIPLSDALAGFPGFADYADGPFAFDLFDDEDDFAR